MEISIRSDRVAVAGRLSDLARSDSTRPASAPRRRTASAVGSGTTLVIDAGGTASGPTVLGTETVLYGGVDSAAVIGNGGVQLAYGSAAGAVVGGGGAQIVAAGGAASDTLIEGGTLDLQAGGLLAGSVGFAGGGTHADRRRDDAEAAAAWFAALTTMGRLARPAGSFSE